MRKCLNSTSFSSEQNACFLLFAQRALFRHFMEHPKVLKNLAKYLGQQQCTVEDRQRQICLHLSASSYGTCQQALRLKHDCIGAAGDAATLQSQPQWGQCWSGSVILLLLPKIKGHTCPYSGSAIYMGETIYVYCAAGCWNTSVSPQ